MRPTLVILSLLVAGCGEQKVGAYNAPPVVSISSPPDGSSVDEGTTVDFVGLVSDSGTAPQDLLIQWSSSIDGILTEEFPADPEGNALYSTASLSPGNHVITLAATDDRGERTPYSIDLTVNEVPDAPDIILVHPTGGESAVEGQSFEFVVQVSDPQQSPDTLQISMQSDIDGVFCNPTADITGRASCDQVLSVGDHHLTFTVVDDTSLSATEEYVFTVIDGRDDDGDGDGYTEHQGDCDDGDASVSPVATEYYNERDDDCDGIIDDGTVGYDDDGDGQSELDGDCDDTLADTYQGATETCDGRDNDCDRTVDENTTCYDDDGDGYTEVGGDCNDGSAISYPGAAEVSDGLDNDCDGIIDEGTAAYDDDFDGYSEAAGDCNDADPAISPAATETCDGYDDNCDGSVDEENASGCGMYYYDYDGDAYGSSSVSGKCLCTPTGYYTASYNTDCYDYNSSANPSQTSYSTSQRGDGSYDWNCDGSQTKYYTSSGDCSGWITCAYSAGWDGSTPACGGSGSYVTDCDTTWYGSCYTVDATYTQRCL
jgi:hypothetical protein